MSASVKTGAYPDKTPDGKDIVYVAMPSIETTEQYLQASLRSDAAHLRGVEIGARIQALALAKDYTQYHRAIADEPEPQTLDEKVNRTVDIAALFESYLLKD